MVSYLKEHIKDEIEGAKEYYTKAVECKAKHPEMASKFYAMAEMEVEHANALTKMFNAAGKPESMSDMEYSEAQKSIINDYTTSMSAIESLKKLYRTS